MVFVLRHEAHQLGCTPLSTFHRASMGTSDCAGIQVLEQWSVYGIFISASLSLSLSLLSALKDASVAYSGLLPRRF